jgi:hypothetical protein
LAAAPALAAFGENREFSEQQISVIKPEQYHGHLETNTVGSFPAAIDYNITITASEEYVSH